MKNILINIKNNIKNYFYRIYIYEINKNNFTNGIQISHEEAEKLLKYIDENLK